MSCLRVGSTHRAASENLLEFLNVDKGKRIFKRALPRLSEAQRIGIFKALIRIFDRLDVVATPIRSQVAIFMESVMAPVGALLSRLPFDILPASLTVMLDTMSLFGIFNLASSKVCDRRTRTRTWPVGLADPAIVRVSCGGARSAWPFCSSFCCAPRSSSSRMQ